MNRKAALILFIFFIAFLTSCSVQKQAIKAPIKEEGADYLFTKLKENELKYIWFNAKFSAEYENKDNKNSFSGQIRIRKDSVIWLSFSAVIGIEIFRMMVTQDSVVFINRINDTYFSGDYNYVNKFLNTNIDYDILQSFLTGNDLSFYENSKFKATLDNDLYKLSTVNRTKLKKYVKNSNESQSVLIQNIWIDPETFKIMQADVKEIQDPNNKLEANYSSFDHIGNQYFPKEMTFDITAANNIHVKVDFSKIITDVPQQFPFKIPQSYHQVK